MEVNNTNKQEPKATSNGHTSEKSGTQDEFPVTSEIQSAPCDGSSVNTMEARKETFLLNKSQRKRRYLSEIKRAIYSYFSETTVHGFRYVAEGGNIYEKLSWVILIIIGFILSGCIIFQSFKDWTDTPLQTTIDKVSMPIEDLYQPAITVCNPTELKMPMRNRWMYIERILNWIDGDQGR